MATAMEAIMTGEPIPAQRAYELGMVNKVVSPDKVMVEARDLAKRVLCNAPLAVFASRKVAARAMMDSDDDLWRASGEAMRSLASTEDYKEGPLAFIEKRDQSGKGVRLLTWARPPVCPGWLTCSVDWCFSPVAILP